MITGIIKRLKISYLIYNFFHKRLLVHNVPLYKKYGLRKKYYSSISSLDFKGLPPLTQIFADEQKIKSCKIFNEADEETRNSILNYNKKGYLILNKYLSDKEVDDINNDVEKSIHAYHIKESYGGRYLQIVKKSKTIHKITLDEKLIELSNTLINGEVFLFQSINFLKGSEQKTHSDSYHMTTYPEGGLLGIWFALEDVSIDNGPLHYYPGSHQLPYFLNSSFNNEGNRIFLGKHNYPPYAAMINEKINEYSLEKNVFLAKKGDVLIWHANLLHGGEPQLNKNMSRKSMVLHYIKKEVICYHEILQRPAIIKQL